MKLHSRGACQNLHVLRTPAATTPHHSPWLKPAPSIPTHPSQDVPKLLRLLALLAPKNQSLLAWRRPAREGILQQSLQVADGAGRFQAHGLAAGVVYIVDAKLDVGAVTSPRRCEHLRLRVRAPSCPRPPRVCFCCGRCCCHDLKQDLDTTLVCKSLPLPSLPIPLV